jgi:hypothetical protein
MFSSHMSHLTSDIPTNYLTVQYVQLRSVLLGILPEGTAGNAVTYWI